MIFCPNCGHKNDDDAKFCDNCGENLQESKNVIKDKLDKGKKREKVKKD